MIFDETIPERWQRQRPDLPDDDTWAVPPPGRLGMGILLLEVRYTFYDVLMLGKQGRAGGLEEARSECRKAVDNARRRLEASPKLDLEAIQALIAWELKQAREEFTEDWAKARLRRQPGTPRRYL